jgi:hypothetical protein
VGIHDARQIVLKTLLAATLTTLLCAVHLAQARSGSTPVNPTNSPDGRWTANTNGAGPWTFEFKSQGKTLTGTVHQNGPPEAPIAITDGKVDGTRISFKVKSPDGVRTITFVGRVNAGEISFVRQFDIPAGASRGGNDLYGTLSSMQFVARKAAE